MNFDESLNHLNSLIEPCSISILGFVPRGLRPGWQISIDHPDYIPTHYTFVSKYECEKFIKHLGGIWERRLPNLGTDVSDICREIVNFKFNLELKKE